MDTVSDFLTRIRNAGLARHEKVDVPASRMRVGIAQILKDNNYIRDFRVVKDNKQGLMRVYLRYLDDGKHCIEKIQRVSSPGRRIYVKVDKIPQVRSGFGMSILSTNQGILSSKECVARKMGGELLCTLW